MVGVDADRDVRAVTDAGLPTSEIICNGHLVIAGTLEDQHRLAERGGHLDRVVVAQIQPVGRGRTER
jgi:hypothetical protein